VAGRQLRKTEAPPKPRPRRRHLDTAHGSPVSNRVGATLRSRPRPEITTGRAAPACRQCSLHRLGSTRARGPPRRVLPGAARAGPKMSWLIVMWVRWPDGARSSPGDAPCAAPIPKAPRSSRQVPGT
jgi:hypothetical protein